MLSLRDITRDVQLPNGEDLHVLRGTNLDVEAGEHISIVGHSGTGKSTLLNIVGLLDQPTSGTYTWDGKDVLELNDTQRSRLRGNSVGFVFQQFNLFPTRTVLNNVEVPLLYNSGRALFSRRDRAAEILESVGLGDRLDAMPSQLSGGEQQRVAIARALVRQPRLILADEPTGALDPETGRLVMDVLESAALRNNAALIVISHDMVIAQRANRVYQISDGVLHDVEKANDAFIGVPGRRQHAMSDNKVEEDLT
ncbi:Macrolide export ATP-binding/permease protein MacB [Arcanobacterium haemolyticum]|uniref:ABC transporter ATP-binding protein n=1 Tax=Arcanobacterium haemolyticum TaxID=28264 RepID=UPI000D81F04A|nr:ABC transporter ATP-binding protein [Arcanobacterium haemolyticum]SPT75779.1 Macrolide export ATP-binding/permease protein MacB [Arcanobacterium haemolyticum]